MFTPSSAAPILGLVLLSATIPSYAAWGSTPGAAAHVSDSVVAHGTSWVYSYTLQNTDDCILDCGNTLYGRSILGYWLADNGFALPYFPDAGIVEISDPDGWTHAISNDGAFGLAGAATLVWSPTSDAYRLAVGESVAGFGYRANYSAGKGAFYVTNGLDETYFGDLPIPMSPMAIQAGIAPVPEPSTYVMFLLGLVTLAGFSIQNRNKLP